MSRRYDKTLADYLVIAISPALIMVLVGSLVFFLLEIFYQGNFSGRLHYILSLFIFAAVLVGRISIEEGAERAAAFALPLGLATLLAIFKFVQFKGATLEQFSVVINFGLLGLIWWCAHKLTWDCTMIDEAETSSGEGLLDSAGLGKRAQPSPEGNDRKDPDSNAYSESSPPARWNYWRSSPGKPHAPGVWIVYFSIAALPLFGLGQMAIPAAQADRRQYAFCLLAVYVASGLGLLLTTSFLGLRRYLRQRRLPMPLVMASTWIVLGCTLIVTVMGLALLVPRPNAEYAISQIPNLMGSPDQKPSKHGVGRDGVESEEPGRPSSSADQGKAAGKSDQSDPGGSPSEKRGGGKPAKSNNADQKSQGQSADHANENSSKSDSNQNTKPDQSPTEKNRENPARDSSQRDEKAEGKPQSNKSNEEGPSQPASKTDTESQPPEFTPPRMPDISPLAESLVTFFKLAFYAVIAGFIAFWAWRHHAEIIAELVSFLASLRSFWNQLLGGRSETVGGKADVAQGPAPPRPFAAYADPFATGLASQLSADQLVQYIFEALEAWGRENGCPRNAEHTPHEFVRSAARRAESLRRPTICLADLYCEAAYAPGRLKIRNMQPLKELWQGLQELSIAKGSEFPEIVMNRGV